MGSDKAAPSLISDVVENTCEVLQVCHQDCRDSENSFADASRRSRAACTRAVALRSPFVLQLDEHARVHVDDIVHQRYALALREIRPYHAVWENAEDSAQMVSGSASVYTRRHGLVR